MLRVNDLKLPIDYTEADLRILTSKKIGISLNKIKTVRLYRRSIDARNKDNIVFIATVDVELVNDESFILKKCKTKGISKADVFTYNLPVSKKLERRPVVIGAGPAGLFCALILARAGQCPLIIERGNSVDKRTKDVNEFWQTGKLNINSNVQFGEGGAGTFSDGKLNTGTKDIRSRLVLTEFVNHGAPEEILYNAKPHIGTDKLKETVKNIRKEIINLGGEVRFCCTLNEIETKNNSVCGISFLNESGAVEKIETNNVVLALGHSARDTFEMLLNSGFAMIQKPFSVGVRIEHHQENINKSQYGSLYNNKKLGAADYKLNVHLKNGRGVYTFCMCPGGCVVAAASEANMVVTNGMSEFARDKTNANSALLVGVVPGDFESDHPLSGMQFQRKIEKAAFIAGGSNYKAPVQRLGDFLAKKKTISIGSVVPSYKPGYNFACVEDYLPNFVAESLREAIPLLDKRLVGFGNYDAVLTGAETRSSSPVRILRGENLESVNVSGVYPCGEGAGYAGGIVSAAVDGIKCAEAILEKSGR